LHADSLAVPSALQTWPIRVGVIADAPAAARVGGLFTAAQIEYYPDAAAAVAALQAESIDLVFDTDIILRQYATSGLTLTTAPGQGWPQCVAVALGNRALLNAVDRSLRAYKELHPELPSSHNRKTIADIGKVEETREFEAQAQELDESLRAIRKRGVLRVGIHPGVAAMCVPDGAGGYAGLEPDLAQVIADAILGPGARISFVPLSGDNRWKSTRSILSNFDDLRKSIGMFGTLVGTNWWNLGMAGKLPSFLCPPECVGTLDFVGIDYYWGISSIWPGELHRLSAAAECHYAMAPVWPGVLDGILREAEGQFPGKPIIIIENGCVTATDGFTRAKYLSAHIGLVERALKRGAPIEAYLCWSITSNREWGLPFDDNSDFGLYHIDLDHDDALKRLPTDASQLYADLISAHSQPQT
jgi:ABC-type amino acid transport substrate-binding protein